MDHVKVAARSLDPFELVGSERAVRPSRGEPKASGPPGHASDLEHHLSTPNSTLSTSA